VTEITLLIVSDGKLYGFRPESKIDGLAEIDRTSIQTKSN
jgi:hypothetical protein